MHGSSLINYSQRQGRKGTEQGSRQDGLGQSQKVQSSVRVVQAENRIESGRSKAKRGETGPNREWQVGLVGRVNDR